MKLLRHGPVGAEKPGALDANGQIRDLSLPTRDGKEIPDNFYRAAGRAPTPEELERRREIVNRIRKIRSRQPESAGPSLSTQQMLRDDRTR